MSETLTFRFIGDNWDMELSPGFFWDRSLASCRKAIKYALEDVEINREELKKLVITLETWTQNKQVPNVTETRYRKFIRLLDFMEGEI